MTEGADVPAKKQNPDPPADESPEVDPEETPAPEPVPGTAVNISGDPVWVDGTTVPPGEPFNFPDVTDLPADIWETK